MDNMSYAVLAETDQQFNRFRQSITAQVHQDFVHIRSEANLRGIEWNDVIFLPGWYRSHWLYHKGWSAQQWTEFILKHDPPLT